MMAPREVDHVSPAAVLSVRRKGGYTIVTISGEIDIARTRVA
jgi:hypothetical protein